MDEVRTLTAMRAGALWRKQALVALNGQAGDELEELVALSHRRKAGAFFTNHTLADRLLEDVEFGSNPIVYDPACGAGDLLLAAARILGRRKSLRDTVQLWGNALRGTDRVPHFVDATNARLLLQARIFHPQSQIGKEIAFGQIFVGNALRETELLASATHVVMNPPFVSRRVSSDCDWTSGKVNMAAVFVEHVLVHMRAGAQLFAILPEVLRTGSRYSKWRSLVSRAATSITVESVGLFSGTADVDVFFLRLTRGSPPSGQRASWGGAENKQPQSSRMEDWFEVSVGPVVPYRDPHDGKYHPFAHPRNVAAWEMLSQINESRQWKGRLIKPPFVVLRRTSRPGDEYRATASIIRCAEAVAVENHLIVCSPKDGLLTTCRKLMRCLRSNSINEHLNERMRCRHLTVRAVRDIPLPDDFAKRD